MKSHLPTLFLSLFLSLPLMSFAQAVNADGEQEPLVTVTLNSKPPLHTVPYLDLQRYQGKWFEIARIQNNFQRNCLGNVTANYKVLENGELEVINSCMETDGATNIATGRGKIKDAKTNAKLKVSFFDLFGKYVFVFGGDYWVIDLDQNYQWAVVGTPSRKYGWILSRKPVLDKATLLQITRSLKEKNYDPCEFYMTLHGLNGGEKPKALSLCNI